MPQVTVYIRKEDLEAWEGMEKKSVFIHNALNGLGGDVPREDPPPPKVVEESQDGPDDYKPTPAIVRELERLKKA